MTMALPSPLFQNDKSACGTCSRLKKECDRALPHCRACTTSGIRCRGYEIRLRWPHGMINRSDGQTLWSSPRRERGGPLTVPADLSSLGLPQRDNFYMQHFLHNVSRLALAVDYSENGYRALLPMAMAEPALLNGLLAVAASHYSRWQRLTDLDSPSYLRLSTQALTRRFSHPQLVHSSITLACIMVLVTFEVFSGSNRWILHFRAIRGWIKSRGNCSDIEAFLKNWVCLVYTQCSMNCGMESIDEIESWLTQATINAQSRNTTDVLFGCSLRLPSLMCTIANFGQTIKSGQLHPEEIRIRATELQEQIRSTAVAIDCSMDLGITCQTSPKYYSAIIALDQCELQRRLAATSEIFRHSSHLYLFRHVYGPEEPLTEDIQESLETAIGLLPLVPDVLGPGANLGWCLVVLGAELDSSDQREYIRYRWEGLKLLGMANSQSGAKILEQVWNHRDKVTYGNAVPRSWQDVMEGMGESQILV